jgi:hypothetical protein
LNIDWDIVVKIAVPLGTLVLGKYLDRWLAKRPKLITYLGHASAFTLRGENLGVIHTHAIVVRNAGRETANNVRIGHHVLPEQYQLYPAVPHTVERDPNGVAEIVISKMVPAEQVTVSYLYSPPLLWSQIHAYTKSDEGFARVLNVLPTPQLPKWALNILRVILFAGVVSLLYLAVEFLRWLLS